MKSLYFSFLFVVLSFCSQAQVWDWVQTIHPGGDEYCWDVTNDSQGNLLATGRVKAYSTFGSGAHTASPAPISVAETDVFLAKYRPNGDLVWVDRDGGKQPDWGRAVTTDISGNVFITGDYCDTAHFGTHQIIGQGASQNRNIFIAKYDSMGVCQWAKTAGNSGGYSRGYGVAADSAGNCYVTGHIAGPSDFDGITFGVSGISEMFIAKFSPAGVCQWVKTVPTAGPAEGNDIKIDHDGNLVFVGGYKGTIVVNGTSYTGTSPSWSDVFIMKINQAGTILWFQKGNGPYQDQGNAVDFDSNNNVYVVGSFANYLNIGGTTIYSVGTGTTATTANAVGDVFVVKYDKNGVFKWVKTIGNSVTGEPDVNDITGDDLAVTPSNKILVTGFLFGTTNMAGTMIYGDTANHNGYVSAFDTLGNLSWYKVHSGVGTYVEPRGISSDSHSNCFIGGEFIGSAVTFDSTTVQSYNGWDGLIAKLYPPLQPVVAASRTAVCPMSPVNFSVQQDGYPLTYQWSFPGGTPATSALAAPVVQYASAGTYPVSLIISNPYVQDTVVMTNYITVNSTALAVNLGPDSTICSGQIITLNAGAGYSSYAWNNAASGQTMSVNATGQYSVIVTDTNGCTGSDTVNVVVSVCTGIDDNSGDVSVSIGPNPASSYAVLNTAGINFNKKPVTFQMYNSMGQLAGVSQQIEKERTELDVTSLAPGIYFYKLMQDNSTLKAGRLVILK